VPSGKSGNPESRLTKNSIRFTARISPNAARLVCTSDRPKRQRRCVRLQRRTPRCRVHGPRLRRRPGRHRLDLIAFRPAARPPSRGEPPDGRRRGMMSPLERNGVRRLGPEDEVRAARERPRAVMSSIPLEIAHRTRRAIPFLVLLRRFLARTRHAHGPPATSMRRGHLPRDPIRPSRPTSGRALPPTAHRRPAPVHHDQSGGGGPDASSSDSPRHRDAATDTSATYPAVAESSQEPSPDVLGLSELGSSPATSLAQPHGLELARKRTTIHARNGGKELRGTQPASPRPAPATGVSSPPKVVNRSTTIERAREPHYRCRSEQECAP